MRYPLNQEVLLLCTCRAMRVPVLCALSLRALRSHGGLLPTQKLCHSNVTLNSTKRHVSKKQITPHSKSKHAHSHSPRKRLQQPDRCPFLRINEITLPLLR